MQLALPVLRRQRVLLQVGLALVWLQQPTLALVWALRQPLPVLKEPALVQQRAEEPLVQAVPRPPAVLLEQTAVQREVPQQLASHPLLPALSLAELVVNTQVLRSNQFYPILSGLANRSERFLELISTQREPV
ncbi:hypothetical protein GCM10027085_59660 [Spirosoma aerophilum]